jgi:hypothetical protein
MFFTTGKKLTAIEVVLEFESSHILGREVGNP